MTGSTVTPGIEREQVIETAGAWGRAESLFLVVVAALGGAGVAGVLIRQQLLAVPNGSAAWRIAAVVVTVGLSLLAFWGVYRSLRSGSIRQWPFLLYLAASMIVFGSQELLVQLPLSFLTVVFRSSSLPFQVGIDVGGVALFLWYWHLQGPGQRKAWVGTAG